MLFRSFCPSFNLTEWTKILTLIWTKHHLEFIKSTASQAPIPERLEYLGWGRGMQNFNAHPTPVTSAAGGP